MICGPRDYAQPVRWVFEHGLDLEQAGDYGDEGRARIRGFEHGLDREQAGALTALAARKPWSRKSILVSQTPQNHITISLFSYKVKRPTSDWAKPGARAQRGRVRLGTKPNYLWAAARTDFEASGVGSREWTGQAVIAVIFCP